MKHLIGIEDLTKEELLGLLTDADNFIEVSEREIKKVPALRGKTIINLFLENSTRTRVSFEIAGKRLSADTINVSSSGSSVSKGETVLDTVWNLEAMNPDIVVIRHKESGAPKFLADNLKNVSIVNGGDGMHEHPTQALLDCLTIQKHFAKAGRSLEGLKIAIVGDVFHSRVARSNLWAHKLLGNTVTVVAPPTLVPRGVQDVYGSSLSVTHNLAEGIEGADVVMCLRMQLERQGNFFVPTLDDYTRRFCVTEKLLKHVAPHAVVLHPGPMNRGVEIASDVADGPRSLIGSQVNMGVAVRMAVLFKVGRGQLHE
jgi:aspartate carbamoyltransferase catalytic subunit